VHGGGGLRGGGGHGPAGRRGGDRGAVSVLFVLFRCSGSDPERSPVLLGDQVLVLRMLADETGDELAHRNRLQAAFDVRMHRIVAGYYAMAESLQTNGSERTIINVQECPIQHADNVRLLMVMRDVITELGWPVYDRVSGRGLVRGMIGWGLRHALGVP